MKDLNNVKKVFVRKENVEGFVDGCFDNATLSSPTGICNRQLTIFICENLAAKQGAIRVFLLLNGLVAFKSIWNEFNCKSFWHVLETGNGQS